MFAITDTDLAHALRRLLPHCESMLAERSHSANAQDSLFDDTLHAQNVLAAYGIQSTTYHKPKSRLTPGIFMALVLAALVASAVALRVTLPPECRSQTEVPRACVD